MAKTETAKINFTSDFLSIGKLMCNLGSVGREGLSAVLITNTYMKTYGNGIFCKYSYDPVGFSTPFVPIDTKMFFNRESGEYQVNILQDSSIELKGKGRKSNIPFMAFQEYNTPEEYDETLEFRCPGNELMKELIFSNEENTILKMKLTKDDLSKIQSYQSYLGHKANEECFKILRNPDNKKELVIRIEDISLSSGNSRKNKRFEEIVVNQSMVETNNMVNSEMTIIYSPKYMPSDDYIMTIYKMKSKQSEETRTFIKFEGNLLDIVIYTLANENSDETANALSENVSEKEEAKEEVKEQVKKTTAKKNETPKEKETKDLLDDILDDNFEEIKTEIPDSGDDINIDDIMGD